MKKRCLTIQSPSMTNLLFGELTF